MKTHSKATTTISCADDVEEAAEAEALSLHF